MALASPACQNEDMTTSAGDPVIQSQLAQYATFRLTADLGTLTPQERAMIPPLIEAARQMDEIFWPRFRMPKRDVLSKSTTAPGIVWATTGPSSAASAPSPKGLIFILRI